VNLRLVVLLAGLLCFAGRASAQGSPEDYHAELGLIWWKPTPEIVLSSGAGGTPVDFVSQFALERGRFREFRVVLKPARKHKLRYSSVPIEYAASATLTEPITFQGQTYPAGASVSSELNWTLMRFGYEWDPVANNMGFIGVFADVKYNKVDAKLTGPAPVGLQTFERNVPVPTVGGAVRGYLARTSSVTAEFTALRLKTGDTDAKFYDFDVYLTSNFGRNAGVLLGYRRVSTDYAVEGDTGNLKLKGPYFGGVLRF